MSWTLSDTLPNVFVSCHNPTLKDHGEIVWDGHNIVGYVDVTPPGAPPKKNASFSGLYCQGWDAIPTELQGTMDIVLALYCPIMQALEHGEIKTLAPYPVLFSSGPNAGTPVLINGKPTIVKDYNEIIVRAFALLKPGGTLLFPNIRSLPDQTRILLEEKLPPPPAGQEKNAVKNSVEFVDIGDQRPQRTNGSGNAQLRDRTRPWLKITKPTGGGRRRKTHRRKRRRYSRSSVRKPSKM